MSGRVFNFRLERVRSLREREEDLARQALAHGLAERHAGQAAVEAAAHDVRRARESTRTRVLSAHGTSAAELAAAQTWIERTEARERDALLDLDRREAEVEARRIALATAARKREAIERLRQKRHADWQREHARIEAIQTDELALQVHRRARIGAAA